jgi:ankyrin repeat protein
MAKARDIIMSSRDLRLAAEKGHLDVVERLLNDNRVNPVDDGNFAIIWAADKGHLDVVERLLKDKRVDPSTVNNHAIEWAASNGHLAVFNLLWHFDSCREYYE